MSKLTRVLGFGLLATVGLTGVAEAQYYVPPPPGPPPGYYAPPRPYYEPPPPPPGYRCDATYRTPGGPRRHLLCDIAEPRPLGARCACPPPPPPPGYSEGPYLPGVTIR